MIKYKIDILQALKNKGYNTNYVRKNKLLAEATLQKIRNNDTSLTLKNVDTICQLLNCNLSDILEYTSDNTVNQIEYDKK